MYVSYSVEKLYAHDTLLQIIRSVCLCVQYNCSGNHRRKVGCDLEGVPSNARVVDAGHTYSIKKSFRFLPFRLLRNGITTSNPFRSVYTFCSIPFVPPRFR